MTKYIPVDEETFGGTPIPIRYGLNMVPPPRPRAPATNPPKKPKVRIFLNPAPSNTRSLGTMLISSYFFLTVYSAAIFLTEITTPTPISTKNAKIVIQSGAEHLSNTIFLQIFIVMFIARQVIFISCFFHIP